MPENNLCLSAGYTLESIAKVLGDSVLMPVFTFIQPKLASENWGDRYMGMIAFGSIIEGPNPAQLNSIIKDAFIGIIEMINDKVPKVRQTVAFVYYKLSEFVPEVILQAQNTMDLFVNRCLEHINEHHLISTLLMGALKNLYVNANRLGQTQALNGHFQNIF
jgi:importin subunit beta-1